MRRSIVLVLVLSAVASAQWNPVPVVDPGELAVRGSLFTGELPLEVGGKGCCQVQEEAQMEAKGIVPPKAMNVLAGIAEDSKEPVRVAVKERQAWFTCGPVRLTTNLLDGTFPDYTRVIPRDCPIKVQMSTVAALGAVRQAMIGVQSDGVQGVKLSLARDRAVFASFGNDRGSAQASVPVEYAGEPFEIGFKPEYVVEGLKAVNAETFELEMTAPDQAAMIRGTGDFVYVFMPMNLS